MIDIKNLTRSYDSGAGRLHVLDDVSARIERGEFIVLVGRSGSGKSTLLNLIGGIDVPTSGSVIIDGANITAMDEDSRTALRRRHIGFVFQFFNLIPTLTVLENVLLPLELNGTSLADGTDLARDWLVRVGLAGREESFPDELSGGEQQRVAIARALVHNPTLILADEPTGNLDLATAQDVLALLDDLCRKLGKTLVMVTHSPEVVGLADRVFTIRDGHLVIDDVASSPGTDSTDAITG